MPNPTGAIPESERIMHPIYLPFPLSTFRKHFTGDVDAQVKHYVDSVNRYDEFVQRHPERVGFRLEYVKKDCQIEKDEKFWVAACWLNLFYDSTKAALHHLLRKAFGDAPPIEAFRKWEDCLDGKLHLFFEVRLPSPQMYRAALLPDLPQRNLIPFVLGARQGTDNLDIEGPTRLDAILVNEDNGFAVIVEAKVVSDISCSVTYDLTRNQLARTVDVALEHNRRLALPLCRREPEFTLVLLQTPELFKEKPHTRLYGWLMKAYQTDPAALARDLLHRGRANWDSVSKRLGWITWEDCNRALPGCCKWL